jgi:hypothetical protein
LSWRLQIKKVAKTLLKRIQMQITIQRMPRVRIIVHLVVTTIATQVMFQARRIFLKKV